MFDVLPGEIIVCDGCPGGCDIQVIWQDMMSVGMIECEYDLMVVCLVGIMIFRRYGWCECDVLGAA